MKCKGVSLQVSIVPSSYLVVVLGWVWQVRVKVEVVIATCSSSHLSIAVGVFIPAEVQVLEGVYWYPIISCNDQ